MHCVKYKYTPLQTNAQAHKFIYFLTSNELTVQNTNVYNKVCPLNTTLVRIPRDRGVVILLTTRTAAAISFLQPPLKNSVGTLPKTISKILRFYQKYLPEKYLQIVFIIIHLPKFTSNSTIYYIYELFSFISDMVILSTNQVPEIKRNFYA